MPGPGEYRSDPSEGITRIEDLPKLKIRCQCRDYRRRPFPRCGQRPIATCEGVAPSTTWAIP